MGKKKVPINHKPKKKCAANSGIDVKE